MLKKRSSACEKYEYGHLGSLCIKSIFELKQTFKKNKVVCGKTLFFVKDLSSTLHSICLKKVINRFATCQ